MRPQRASDGANLVPQQQIVGFHVEGQSPSPSPSSILQDSMRTMSSGSPTPVIIPPHFQSQTSLCRQDSHGASRSLAPEFAAGNTAAAAGGQNILRTSSLTGDRKLPEVSEAAAAAAGAALPPTAPITGSSPASGGNVAAGKVQQQQQQSPRQQQQQSPRQHKQQQQQDSSTSSSSSSAATAAKAGAPPQAARQDAAQAADAAAAAAAAAAAGAGGPKPPPKPKPTSKAERRALQEAQRAAKAAAKAAEGGGGGAAAAGAARPSKAAPPAAAAAAPSQSGGAGAAGASGGAGAGSRGPAGAAAAGGGSGAAAGGARRGAASASVLHSTELFAHLQQYRPVTVEGVLKASKDSSTVHPAVLALGLRYGDGSITGSTARCVALVHALCQVIADYHTPPGKSLQRDLMATINAAVDFLVRCRPLSVSMGNAIKAVKLYISKTDPAAPEAEAKASLLGLVREWLQEKVAVADRVLVEHAVTKVYDGDVILTYAYSQVVLEVLLSAAAAGRRFRVLVLDSRPELEGRQMLRRLLQADIPCSYVLLSGLSYIMREVSKVILGAAAVLSNGTVLSRAGSAAVAMCAAASSKPVLVCCEAFKFHERVQLDSITHNELGDPAVLAHVPPHATRAAPAGATDTALGAPSAVLRGWAECPRLALLNLKYDAMPAEYVTMVVTEFGMIPPSSVPVILREFSESAQHE